MRRVIQNKPDYTPGTGQGERNMNEMVHLGVHPSVHLGSERKLRGALRLRVTRRLILCAGKTPDWAGATPKFKPGVAPAQSDKTRQINRNVVTSTKPKGGPARRKAQFPKRGQSS